MGNVWTAAYESFRKMLGEFFTEMCKEGDSALGNAGILRKEGENAFIIDLEKYEDEWGQVKRQALDESPLLQSSPFALKLEIKKKAELLLERCMQFLMVYQLRFACLARRLLCSTRPIAMFPMLC